MMQIFSKAGFTVTLGAFVPQTNALRWTLNQMAGQALFEFDKNDMAFLAKRTDNRQAANRPVFAKPAIVKPCITAPSHLSAQCSAKQSSKKLSSEKKSTEDYFCSPSRSYSDRGRNDRYKDHRRSASLI